MHSANMQWWEFWGNRNRGGGGGGGGFGGGQRNTSQNRNVYNQQRHQDRDVGMEVCQTRFTCYGPAGMANTVTGDVSAEELRWMMLAEPPNIWVSFFDRSAAIVRSSGPPKPNFVS